MNKNYGKTIINYFMQIAIWRWATRRCILRSKWNKHSKKIFLQRSPEFVIAFSLPVRSLLHRSSPPEMSLGKVTLKICNKFKRERPCQTAKQIYCNRILTWMFSSKFVAYFWITFSKEHFRMAASGFSGDLRTIVILR